MNIPWCDSLQIEPQITMANTDYYRLFYMYMRNRKLT